MRLMARARWVGACCRSAEVSDHGRFGVLAAWGWFQHARLVNRRVCVSCLEELDSEDRAHYLSAITPAIGKFDRRALTQLAAAR
jgi:hypothetical protein